MQYLPPAKQEHLGCIINADSSKSVQKCKKLKELVENIGRNPQVGW